MLHLIFGVIEMFEVKDRINFSALYSGMDCAEDCFDKKHFENYTKKISYQYNSKGFRDDEWPDDLSNVTWCLGDSFTVGIGQPFEETWPQLLSKKIKKPCINLGQDGCSNDTLSLRATELVKTFKPSQIIIMWSFFHRRRINDIDEHFVAGDFGPIEDLINFEEDYLKTKKLPTKILHIFIPDIWESNIGNKYGQNNEGTKCLLSKRKKIKQSDIDNIICFKQKDYGRDGFHYDIKTTKEIVDKIIEELTQSFK